MTHRHDVYCWSYYSVRAILHIVYFVVTRYRMAFTRTLHCKHLRGLSLNIGVKK